MKRVSAEAGKGKRMNQEKTKIVCLCGSLRFKKHFGVIELNQVLEGNIVLTPCCMYVDAERTDSFMEHKEQFDKMHFKKIELADEIIVVDCAETYPNDAYPKGYIGESTRNEIEHANKMGKPVLFVSQSIDIKDYLNSRKF